MTAASSNLLQSLDLEASLGPRILSTAIKPFAAEYMSHAPLEALFGILKDHRLEAADVESMSLKTFRTAVEALAKPERYGPQTRETADHSLPYCLAIGLLEGDLGPAQFAREQWNDPVVIALMSRITIIEDPALTRMYPPARPTWRFARPTAPFTGTGSTSRKVIRATQ